MQITQNCIINGMPESVYHADPTPELEGFKESTSLSSSVLNELMEKTEAQARLKVDRFNPECDKKSSDAMDFGDIAHDYVLLEGKRAIFEIVPFKDFRTDDAKARRDDLLSRNIIPLADNEKTRAMLESVKTMKARLFEQIAEHREWNCILQKGMPEQSGFAFDDLIWNRARFDWIDETHENLIVDYKTTGLDFHSWEKRELWSGKYFQDVHYRRVLDLINGKDKPKARFIYVVQQTSEPYLMQIFEIDKSYHDTIEQRYLLGRQRFVNCLKTGIWRGVPPYTAHCTPPSWVEQKWEMDALNEQFMAEREAKENGKNGEEKSTYMAG